MTFITTFDSFKQVISPVLAQNPTIRNSALSGLVAAHMTGFNGYIQISDCKAKLFQSDGLVGVQKPAKIIYISPYGGFWSDLLISIKRIFAGVTFSSNSGSKLQPYLVYGQRITVFCALDGSHVEAEIEQDRTSLPVRIYRTIRSCRCFSCCHS